MRLNELLENIYKKEKHDALNREHLICDISDIQTLIALSTQDQASTVKLASVFEDKLLGDDFKTVIGLFENEELDAARKILRSLEKEYCSFNDQLIIKLLILYADASLWALFQKERYKTRFEDNYANIINLLQESVDTELLDQFKHDAILMIRNM